MIFILLIQKQDGNIISLQPTLVLLLLLLLLHPGGNHPTAGGQHGIVILHHGMSNRFLCRCENFRLQEIAIPLQATAGVHRTPCRLHFSHALSLSGSHPSLTSRALAWLKMKLCAFSKTVHTSRNKSYITPELTSTISLCTRTPSYPSARRTSTSRVSILARSIPATIHK